MTVAQEKKPIAVLTNKVTEALDFLQIDKKIRFREIRVPRRLLIGEDGQVYVLIFDPQQLLGLEISDIITVPGVYRNSRYEEMYAVARTRIR